MINLVVRVVSTDVSWCSKIGILEMRNERERMRAWQTNRCV